MLEIASEIIICLVLAGLIGFLLGFLVAKVAYSKSKSKNKNPEKPIAKKQKTKNKKKIATNEAIEEVETLVDTMSEEIKEDEITIPSSPAIEDVTVALKNIEVGETAVKPTLLDAAKDGTKDPLTTIKGIGPKVEEQLNAAGIFYFEQIANWNEENIQWLEVNTTFAHRAKKDLWVNQAKALLS